MTVGPAPRRGLGRTRRAFAVIALLGPATSWLAIFFVAPMCVVAAYSVGLLAIFPGDEGFSLEGWRSLISDGLYLGLFWKSVRIALIVSAICLVLAYPIAYFLAFCTSRRKYILLILIVAPFWTSFLLRVFSWKVILGDQGILNSFVFWTGLRAPDQPLEQLLYSQFTVILVLAYIWIPFVALPIFVSLENLDTRLLEAAADLGATRWQTFLRITLPLSIPGVVAAFFFVFIPTIGEFVTPLLVGGNRGFMYGNAVAELFGAAFDWRTGSVLALFLLCAVLTFTILFARLLNLRRESVIRLTL